MSPAIISPTPTYSDFDLGLRDRAPALPPGRYRGRAMEVAQLTGIPNVMVRVGSEGAGFEWLASASDDEPCTPTPGRLVVGDPFRVEAAELSVYFALESVCEVSMIGRFAKPATETFLRLSDESSDESKRIPDDSAPPVGSAAAILRAMGQPPHLHPSVVEAMERRIELGRLPLSDPPEF